MADFQDQNQINGDKNNHQNDHRRCANMNWLLRFKYQKNDDHDSNNHDHIEVELANQLQQPRPQPRPIPLSTVNWLNRFKYRKNVDPHNEMRNVLLIVSALIATVTFQAGVNPPGGVWQDSDGGHIPGSAIYATHKEPFYTFLIFNTLALSSSIMVILSLTFMFPFSVEIWIATVSMIVTYGSSVFAITPFHHRNYKFRYILFTAACPIVVRVVVEVCRYVKRKFFDDSTEISPTA